jgi:hypothetical protein
LYSNGQGVPQDYKEALKWFRAAAEQGYDKAQCLLGILYFNGQGAPQDYKEAIKWYRAAAEQGNADAQALLGAMYWIGNGVAEDYVLAYMWFNLSAAEGLPRAIEGRKLISSQMTQSQIEEAQRLSREWKPKPNNLLHQ